jgi:hypothetical protein
MKSFALPLLLLACGCQDRGPPAPTQEQSAQLNEAEDMLNDAAKQEGPADRSTGPSNDSN